MRRAQAAVEFLMTYGWAILIMVMVLGIFYYLGVLSQQNVSFCGFQLTEFSCDTYKLTSNVDGEGGVILLLRVMKHEVKVIGFNCTTKEEWTLSDFQKPGDNVTIAAGESKTLKGNSTDPLPLPCWKADGTKISGQDAGQSYKGNLYVHYIDLETNSEHKLVGRVSGIVE